MRATFTFRRGGTAGLVTVGVLSLVAGLPTVAAAAASKGGGTYLVGVSACD
jgi:hypothetical protein